jgi:hypothetical protein
MAVRSACAPKRSSHAESAIYHLTRGRPRWLFEGTGRLADLEVVGERAWLRMMWRAKLQRRSRSRSRLGCILWPGIRTLRQEENAVGKAA